MPGHPTPDEKRVLTTFKLIVELNGSRLMGQEVLEDNAKIGTTIVATAVCLTSGESLHP